MKRSTYFVILILFFFQFVLGQEANSLQKAFSKAYQKHPNIPYGLLESMAYSASRMENLQPLSEEEHHQPNRYGLFGLVKDGKGYFKNNLLTVCEYNRVSISEFLNNPALQIECVAAYLEALIQKHRATLLDLKTYKPVLEEFMEIPNYKDEINTYARNVYIYDIFYHAQKGFDAAGVHLDPIPVDMANIFDKETLKILQSPKINLNATTKTITTDYPPALWVASPHYSSRGSSSVSAIVIHTVQGSYAGCISWFQNPSSNVSAHYVIRSSDGQVTQMVREMHSAWHAKSANPYTIGIEHEGYVSNPSWYTPAMYNSSAALVRDICDDYGIPKTSCYNGPAHSGLVTLPSSYKIKGHQHYPAQTHTDPGIHWNWANYYNLINNITTSPCNTPTGLTTNSITTNSATASWTAVSGAVSYTVRIAPASSTAWTSYTTTSTNFTFSGLSSGTSYQWQVRTNCSAGSSTYSASQNFTTLTATCNVPTGLATKNVTSNSAQLSWSAVTGAVSYTIQYKLSSSSTWTTVNTTATTYKLSGLSANSAYQWQVRTNCSSGSSVYSTAQNFTTEPNSATTCAGTWMDSGGNSTNYSNGEDYTFTIAPTGASSVSVTFTSFSLENGYDFLYAYDGTSTTAPLIGTYTGTTSPGTITALSGAITFRFVSDAATTASGWIANWNCTPCNNPTTFSTTSISTNSATLNWNAVPSVATYEVRIKPVSSSAWTTYSGITTNSYTVTGLNHSTNYEWQVRSFCNSAFSASTLFTTSAPPCNVPTGLSTTNINTTTATLNWNAVTGATSYTVEYKPASASTWTSQNTTALLFNLSGLSASTSYQWRVRTNCGSGSSAFSSIQNFTTQPPCYDPNESNNSSTTATVLALNSSKQGKICGSSTDYDWFKVTLTSTSNLKVTLSNLPDNYNMELYVGGTYQTGSYNSGTTNEVISLSNKPAGNYYYRVYGATPSNANSLLDYTIAATNVLLKDEEVADISIPEYIPEPVMFPNPAHNEVFFDIVSIMAENIAVQIFDLQGKIVKEQFLGQNIGENIYTVSLQDVGQGVYIVKLVQGNKISFHKLVLY
ncbi:MAG: fibronectin type III domain-containing protein [Bacteroidia bacterium]|nr:fibronectin type III domain-containing protein [Bacteroidia bacterium]MDW8301851.1 fibronectin type III domain-containing protein [Bacteroidia bacterium]